MTSPERFEIGPEAVRPYCLVSAAVDLTLVMRLQAVVDLVRSRPDIEQLDLGTEAQGEFLNALLRAVSETQEANVAAKVVETLHGAMHLMVGGRHAEKTADRLIKSVFTDEEGA